MIEGKTLDYKGGPETKMFSKVNGKLCTLKMKVFSSDGYVEVLDSVDKKVLEIPLEESPKDRSFSGSEEKKFSVATVKERVRMAKFSPRQRFRRMILDWKKFADLSKDMSQEEYKVAKDLFVTDVMSIMNTITPDVMQGKQINTLLGLSVFGKELRLAGQELQIPYRLAMQEEKRTGAVTKMRYQAIQDAYNKFTHALIDHVFSERLNNIDVLGTASTMNEMQDNTINMNN